MKRRKRKRTKAERDADARRTGRPPKPPGKKWSECVMARMTKAERARLEAEAKRLGVSLSGLLMKPWREGE